MVMVNTRNCFNRDKWNNIVNSIFISCLFWTPSILIYDSFEYHYILILIFIVTITNSNFLVCRRRRKSFQNWKLGQISYFVSLVGFFTCAHVAWHKAAHSSSASGLIKIILNWLEVFDQCGARVPADHFIGSTGHMIDRGLAIVARAVLCL